MRLPTGSVLALATALLLSGAGVAAGAVPQSPAEGVEASKPLTGRALRCDNGRIERFRCKNVELLSYLPADAIGGAAGEDLWGWTDSATGREFVAMGGKTGTAFVEVTDPVNPKYLGILPPRGNKQHSAQSVKVYRHYALIGFEASDYGMQVFDLTQLRDVKSPPAVFQETAHYDGFASTHTIAINAATGFAYANGTNTCGGLHMIDVRTPTKPTAVGCYRYSGEGGTAGTGYVHDTQCTVYRGPDRQYQKREICFNGSGSAVVIVDVTDKQTPKTISVAHYPNIGYAHQGWLTEDQRYFFLDDEFDETQMPTPRTRTIVFDLNDLDDPVVLTEYYAATGAVDHNLYIRGRYMYQGNFNAGLRIIDVAEPKEPKEVGYLSEIGNAWGTYPFFKKDMVAVPADTGLFLVRLLTQ